MKHKVFLLLLLSALSVQAATLKHRTRAIERPVYLLSTLDDEQVMRLELSDTATVLYVKCDYPPYDVTWSNPYSRKVIVDGDTLSLRSATLLSSKRSDLPVLALQRDSSYSFDYDSLRLVFPALSSAQLKAQPRFTYQRTSPYGGGSIIGVRTDGKAYQPLTPIPPTTTTAMTSLTPWKPRSGLARLRVTVLGYTNPQEMQISYFGNSYSLTSDPFDMKVTADSAGHFTVEADLCYPTPITIGLGVRRTYTLIPGEDIDVTIDLARRSLLNGMDEQTTSLRPRYTFQRGGIPELDAVRYREYFWNTSSWITAEWQARRDDHYSTYVEREWANHQSRLAALHSDTSLTEAQRQFLSLMSERAYIDRRSQFLFSKQVGGAALDSAATAAWKAEVTLVDPHAADLQLPYTLATCYVAYDEHLLPYLEANSLADTPYGRWISSLCRAKAAVRRLQLFDLVDSPAGFADVDSTFVPRLWRLNEANRQTLQSLPTTTYNIKPTPMGDPTTWLTQIVSEHRGHAVLIDFWATWCGPCMQGMKAMERVKPTLRALGADVVYITDESSNATAWAEVVKEHAGDHYRIASGDLDRMSIPHYSGGIPHYLLYDANGQLIFHQCGFDAALPDKILDAVRTAKTY